MDYLIYQTTNTINGKIYIGCHKTTNINDGYQGSGKILLRAIKKYGKENFTTIVLHKYDNSIDMLTMEAKLVNESFVKRSDTYNLKKGGEGGFDYINEHVYRDPQYRQLISEKISKGLLKYYETNTPHFLGKTHSEETKKKISVSKKITSEGSDNSQYRVRWITNNKENKTIKKDDDIPAGWHYGRHIEFTYPSGPSPLVKPKFGSFSGKKHSEETKKKMSSLRKITSKGSRNSQFGTRWITNETESKKIKKDADIPSGWRAGRAIIYIKL